MSNSRKIRCSLLNNYNIFLFFSYYQDCVHASILKSQSQQWLIVYQITISDTFIPYGTRQFHLYKVFKNNAVNELHNNNTAQ